MPSSYSLGDHFEGFIRELLDRGRHNSASEVARDSLRLLEEREHLRATKLQALRQAIQDGLHSGPLEPLDMEHVKAEARCGGKPRTKPPAMAGRIVLSPLVAEDLFDGRSAGDRTTHQESKIRVLAAPEDEPYVVMSVKLA